MVDYARLAAVAERLINANGRTLTFQEAVTVADATEPWRGGAADAEPASAEAIGVVIDYDLREIDEKLVLRGDKRCFTRLPGGDVDSKKFVSVVDSDNGEVWKIVQINKIAPGTVMLVYDIQLRQ
mgnify:CR=1 FL=1